MKFYRQILSRTIKRMCEPSIRNGVEVGVARGKTSVYLLNRFPDLTLWMVDTWAEAIPGTPYHATAVSFASVSQATHDARLRETRERVARFGTRARILRQDSKSASAGFRNGELDFVFIDDDHSYEGCRSSISAWFDKVRPGGLFCGHDYVEPRTPAFGVKRAVDEFVEESGLILVDGGASIWWAIKP